MKEKLKNEKNKKHLIEEEKALGINLKRNSTEKELNEGKEAEETLKEKSKNEKNKKHLIEEEKALEELSDSESTEESKNLLRDTSSRTSSNSATNSSQASETNCVDRNNDTSQSNCEIICHSNPQPPQIGVAPQISHPFQLITSNYNTTILETKPVNCRC